MTDDARRAGSLAAPPAEAETIAALTSPVGMPGPASGYAVPAQPVPAAPATGAGDRMWVHVTWEALLLVLLMGGVGLWWLFGGTSNLLRDPALLGNQLYAVAPFLLLATALAMSIRVRAVNLAVAAVAALAAVLFTEWESESQLVAVGLVAAAALAVGVILSVLVVGLRIPGWAASLGMVVAVLATAVTVPRDGGSVLLFGRSTGGLLGSVPQSTTLTTPEGLVWGVVLAVAVVSVVGGVIGVLPAVRRRLQECREAAQADRRSRSAALTTSAALLVSSLLAGAAGVLWVVPSASAAGGIRIPPGTLEPVGIALALAIVLLGGTSIWGRRGGVFGTLLAALAVFAVFVAFDELGWTAQSYWITVGALALGFLVSSLVDGLGARRPGAVGPAPALAAAPAEPHVPVATGVPETVGGLR